MNVVGIIPARYDSTRLLGKALMDICGKPMLWWVYQQVIKSKKINNVYAAIDNEQIEELCKEYSIPYIMTRNQHPTAANRLQEVSEQIRADFYVQINGDEPLIDVHSVDRAIPEDVPRDEEFGTNIVTQIHDPALVVDASNIKVVFDNKQNILYMSRTPIPYPFKSIDYSYYKHVGILGYNKKMLDFYKNSKPGKLELIEGIDTLRFLDYGKTLKAIEVEQYESLSVDTMKDLEYVRGIVGKNLSRSNVYLEN